jgi:peptidoglycan hydrolase CwlO-like protein
LSNQERKLAKAREDEEALAAELKRLQEQEEERRLKEQQDEEEAEERRKRQAADKVWEKIDSTRQKSLSSSYSNSYDSVASVVFFDSKLINQSYIN